MCIRDRSLEHAGASALVVECVPAEVAARISVAVGIPTIGIGAGPFTDGQVLVYHDLLGVMQNEPNTQCAPRFCKTFISVGPQIDQALRAYRDEVKASVFPSAEFSPYSMSQKQLELFDAATQKFVRGTEKLSHVQAERALGTELDGSPSGGLEIDGDRIRLY
eukprot:TRINITY_DN9456_c0_g1_i1.p1 TRINITY_DN9456_c0_g1~~TRINITY_DN9456_c0_g1_i1.p1  ORF type:complete len:163 (+),score=34.86 TRINITY_DN9456_c0_g1_i1:146-634(+)